MIGRYLFLFFLFFSCGDAFSASAATNSLKDYFNRVIEGRENFVLKDEENAEKRKYGHNGDSFSLKHFSNRHIFQKKGRRETKSGFCTSASLTNFSDVENLSTECIRQLIRKMGCSFSSLQFNERKEQGINVGVVTINTCNACNTSDGNGWKVQVGEVEFCLVCQSGGAFANGTITIRFERFAADKNKSNSGWQLVNITLR